MTRKERIFVYGWNTMLVVMSFITITGNLALWWFEKPTQLPAALCVAAVFLLVVKGLWAADRSSLADLRKKEGE